MFDQADNEATVYKSTQRIPDAAAGGYEDVGRQPTVWVLKCHRAGDHAQSLGLARALGWSFTVKETKYHWYEAFFALPGAVTLIGLNRRRSSPLTPPWPDLIIMAGRQNETPAKWIRRQSGGRSRIVVLGRYWTPPDELDLVVTTPQFRLPPHPNVLHNNFPLHPVTPKRLDDAAAIWTPRLAGLAAPYLAVLVGGSSGPYIFSRRTAQRLGREASALARALGASLLICTSARTGRGAMAALERAIDVPCHFYRWRANDDNNPYHGFLALADAFIVTADSMSMLAEACHTHRPVYMFEFGGGPAAMHGPRGRDKRVRQWWRLSQLLDQGLLGLPYAWWIGRPARRLNRSRDIRLVQDLYIRSGRAKWLTDPPQLPSPNAKAANMVPMDDLQQAVRRVRRMMGMSTEAPLPRHPEHANHAVVDFATAMPRDTRQSPRIWVILSDKAGDNAQVLAVADALPWPYDIKRIQVREPYVLGKPKITASLDHVDLARSDRLEAPWPDLVLTSGRRMSMIALWIQERSQAAAAPEQRSKIVLIGLPKGHIERFDLAVLAGHYRQCRGDNLMRIDYPLQRIDETAIAAETDRWRDAFASLPQPLTAVLVGGQTGTVPFDAAAASRLAKDLGKLVASQGGSLVVTTSRRTPPEAVAVLERELPRGAVLYPWRTDGLHNPYRALLGLAERFVVTSDSLSMLMEIARLGRPLAIYSISPAGRAGRWATRLNRLIPGQAARGWLRKLADFVARFAALGHDRDLTALHRRLVADGLAVWFGEQFNAGGRRPVDELARVADRVTKLVEGA
ncbi:mitochondrial fission ELM1 family protein [Dongia soli]|uniref:ELM1/GtrOC1 family putative glycosyltransferase n=1 Tax=Dongia soli TaxID=600628 RepID=A0ABU5E7C5_9PROT|nr:ELM1/GtrOC1 family putative glycosyltransferase [Dongia soli]MDY0882083.1 ELM1/GtrOC1 family putative glycosyltransferase [Dongia soli]